MPYVLSRLCFQNWYLIGAKDIEIKGAAALIGPTGAGKSSIQDGVQTVITGANHNRLNLNASASGRSGRSVLEYCLGLTKDPAEGGKPLRDSCETVLALVFRDEETQRPITVGVAMSARMGDSREDVLSRFIAPDYAYSVEDYKRRSGGRETLAPWSDILENLRKKSPELQEFRASAEKFTGEMLRIMRPAEQPPNPKHVLRAFANGLAFKPIFDPTTFVREYILEPDQLDIDRVRTSIATWQELERVIEDIENKLRRVNRLSDRFRNWGRAKVRAEGARFNAAIADARRCAHDVRHYRELSITKGKDLATERNALATRKQWVREYDEDLRAKNMIIQASGDGSLRRQLEMEVQHVDREMKETFGRIARIKTALGNVAQLTALKSSLAPHHARSIDAAKEAVNLLQDTAQTPDILRNKGEKLQGLVDEVTSIRALEVLLHENADQLAAEIRQLQSDVELMETATSGGQHAVLSTTTNRLINALERRGMQPIPLCDVVEVLEPDWQEAIESLLGRGREAIILPPESVDEAFEMMRREQDVYAGCTLVATNAQNMTRTNFNPGSVLEALSTDNQYAAAFLNDSIGGYQKAETEDDLRRMRQGVMRNGKFRSGMRLSVPYKAKTLMFGKAARHQSTETLRNDLDRSRALLREKSSKLSLLRDAARIVPTALDTLNDGDGPFHLEHALQALSGRLQDLKKHQGEGGHSTETAALLEEIKYIEEQRQLYLSEIEDEIEPRIAKLQEETANARARLETGLEAYAKAYKERQKTWAALTHPDVQKLLTLDPEIDEPDAHTLLKRIRADLRRDEGARSDPKAYLSGQRNSYKVVADNFESEVKREQSGVIREIAEYKAAWDINVPTIDHETMTTGYVWVMGEKARLEGNELRRHRAACEKASGEMRRLLKEDLLSRLAEKLIKVDHKVERLNALLSRYRVTGQTYALTFAVNPRFQKMHDLAIKVGMASDMEAVGLDAQELTEAVGELESLIHGNEGTEKLADYREYFNFEIAMTDKVGSRTTMSSRAVKGSGGEAQAPFYVSFAASMNAAYYPGHSVGTPGGMGLVLFDEAFNKLDVPNTQTLLTLFKDMGLQLVIAGPEDKRATFTEVLDTIILVNKSPDGQSVYIDAEYPGELAKVGLASINPDHGGIDAFRTH
ncbi:SbcC/MukB-like Walker B domain-containing protein [Rhizobium sp. MHM7A]|uniref:SbcC/MukB-like Walker B domain-containing protein n=1 Tax=Rhizobium sp. MHM7A TaxID=2583233 RepID=UPI0011071CD4|nr:SbcC/MukB-like Walker B domain-containing protein [Rhizobium sp. MHM7A]TLX16790.1 hypothetical protein FFR93_05450 [Rhizobium sp. MHM7A]